MTFPWKLRLLTRVDLIRNKHANKRKHPIRDKGQCKNDMVTLSCGTLKHFSRTFPLHEWYVAMLSNRIVIVRQIT